MQTYFKTAVPINKKLTDDVYLKEIQLWLEEDCDVDGSWITEISKDEYGTHNITTDDKTVSMTLLLHPDLTGIRAVFYDEDQTVAHQSLLNMKKKTLSFESLAEFKENCPSKILEYPENTLLQRLQAGRFFGKNDKFSLSNWPMKLREDDSETMTKLLMGKSQLSLPVILVMNEKSDLTATVSETAGIASVIQNDDPALIDIIREEKPDISIPSENSINVFFPGSPVQNVPCPVLETAVKAVKTWALYRKYPDEILFSDAHYAKNEESYRLAMEQYSAIQTEYDQYRAFTDVKLTEKNTKLLDAIAKQGLPKTINSTGGYIRKGKETPLYEDEIEELLWDSLIEYRKKSVQDGSRRADVLDDLIAANKGDEIQKRLKEKHQKVKDTLLDYSVVTPQIKKNLEDLGFKVKTGNTHGKIILGSDPRYIATIASTASDYRAGANLASLVIKSMM